MPFQTGGEIKPFQDGGEVKKPFQDGGEVATIPRRGGNLRADGTEKGQGFFGELQRPDGRVSTELSIGVGFDGKETQIPTLVPTLTQPEIDSLLAGGEITDEIRQKAIEHARNRIQAGQSPFASPGEQEAPQPPQFDLGAQFQPVDIQPPTSGIAPLPGGIADPTDLPPQQLPAREQFEAAPPRTTAQKIGDFFIGKPEDRPFLPGDAGRAEKIDHTIKAVGRMPVRAFVKYSKGMLLGTPELAWAAIKKVTPDDMWAAGVKDMTLDEAMDWAMGYNPSGFSKFISGVAEFAGGISTVSGIQGLAPKSATVVDKALRTGGTFALAKMGRELSKFGAELIDPETDYQYEGAPGVLVDFGIGAGFSLLGSASRPILAAIAKSPAGRVISDGAHRAVIELTKKFPGLADTVRKNPNAYFTKEVLKYAKARGVDLKNMTNKEKAILKHVARESQRRFMIARKNWKAPPDIVLRGPRRRGLQLAEARPDPTPKPPTVQVKPKAVEGVTGEVEFAVKPPKKLFRGITATGKGAGTATLGKGLYSTPTKSFLKGFKFDKIIELTPEEAFPRNPLVINTKTESFEDWLLRESGEKNLREFNKKHDITEFVQSKGFDGVVAGDEVVKYSAPIKAVEPKAKEVAAKVPQGTLSDKPVKVEGKKFHPITLATKDIGVDPERFQFKLGAKLTGGVTEALKDVEKFDPVKGGQILVWQDKAGKFFVVDGHHRVALAKKTNAPSLETWVLKESEGITAGTARAEGALRNLADGKGTAVDAAKLFRDSELSLEDLRKQSVPTNNPIVQQGLAMKDLSDPVFRLVIDGRLEPNMAAAIGKNVKQADLQKQVADLIVGGDVSTVREAELLAKTITSAPVLTKKEQTLFGFETSEKSLFAERAKVLANVEKKLKTNKKVFGILATKTGIIEAKGNILKQVENLAAKEKAEEVLFMLEKLANSKGPIAEALNNATKEYAKNPTNQNLSKITDKLLESWTSGAARLRIPDAKGVQQVLPERAGPKEVAKPPKKVDIKKDLLGKPIHPSEVAVPAKTPKQGDLFRKGKVDITPLSDSFDAFLRVVEPAKLVDRAHGKDATAIIITGIHRADVGRIEFNEAEIDTIDGELINFGEALAKYPKKVLKNLMAARGKPFSPEAIEIQKQALIDLAKETPELIGTRKMITKIADMNYKYLQAVVGDDIKHVEEYFYGIYKNPDKVDNFLNFWKTTKRFTKEKKLPTVADALAFGLELRDFNPVNNLRSEYIAIARLDGMIYIRDELMRTGKGRYIDTWQEAPHDWKKVNDPVFNAVRLEPEMAHLINNLIATNKLRKHFALRTLTGANNAIRTVKFMFSMFHQLNIVKQSIADEGYLKFLQPSATRGITFGFKKNDPIFKTPAYKDYIKHGGSHRFSIESQAQRMISNTIDSLNKNFGKAIRAGTLPLRIPERYVKWMFQSYIPKVKYAKYLDRVQEFENRRNRPLTSAEKIEIIKEQQNFYGMMNERLFGRSGTVTSLMRLWYLSPGYAEGNMRTILKSILQWGGKDGFKASRSRSNIINALIMSITAATVGTLIMTGKPPKKPESKEDIRDLFKIDTGWTDDKGRKVMIDLLTFDKDYWDIIGNTLLGRPDKAIEAAIKRSGGMVAPSAQVVLDIANMAAGRTLYDWKGDRVVEITDSFATKIFKTIAHEIKRTEPIAGSVFKQGLKKEQNKVTAAMTALLGYRPTLTEADKREQQILSRIYSLRGQQEELFLYLRTLKRPRQAVEKYNNTVRSILDSPMTPTAISSKWRKKLIIDLDRLIENKVFRLTGSGRTPDEIKKIRQFLDNFDITPAQAQQALKRYWARPINRRPISPIERDRVLGRNLKRKRLQERME